MRKRFTRILAALMLLTMITQPTRVWGQTRIETVYKTALFGPSYNSTSVGSYTETWYASNDGFRVNLKNFNNNNNDWNYVKCGRKNNASVATIITNAAIDKAITKVDITIDALTVSNINSIKLYTSTNNSNWTSVGTYTKAKGTQSVSLTSPTANLYYKLEFDCASGSSNGLLTLSKVEYYYNEKTDPSLSVSPTALEVSYGETESFTVSQSGDGAITVTSNNTSVATVAQDGSNPNQYNVSYVGDGNTTITVSVAETASYEGDSKTVSVEALDIRDEADISFTHANESAVIAAGNTHTQTLNNPYSVTPITWESSDTDVATVDSDGTVTLNTAGIVTITASFAGDDSYKPGNASYTLTITNKYVADLVFDEDAIEKLTTDAAFINAWETDPSGLAVVFSSSNTDVATVGNTTGQVTIVGAGSTTISAIINDASYEATQFDYSLTVSKADAPISFSASTAEVALDETESFVAPTLSNPQNLTITYSSSNPSVATVNSSTGAISFVTNGVTTITATSTENATYNSGSVSYTLTVNKAAELLPFSHSFTGGSGLGDFTPSASGIWTAHNTYGACAQGNTEGNWLYSPIINLIDKTYATLTFSHATNGVTTPLADMATLWVKEVGGEWEKLTLSYSDNSSWTYVDQTISLNEYCGKKIQLGFKYISSNTTGKWEIKNFRVADDRPIAPISFTNTTVYKLLSDAGTYTGQALTNEEALTVSYVSSNTDVATVNASTGVVAIIAVGETDITATYEETASYQANTATYKLVVTAKAAAEIEYAEATATKKITLGTYTHPLTNPHNLTIVYTSSDPTVATVNSSTGEATLLKVGETTITATFTEDETYEGAAVSYTLTVIKDDPTLSFANSSVNASFVDGTYQQVVSTTPAELPVTYSSSDETVATVASDGTATLLKKGSTTITASFAGNASYNSASTSYTLNVVTNYVTLPFVWAGGTSGDLTNLTGVEGNSLGDYASQNAPYRVQMNASGDYIKIKTDSQPSKVTVKVKMIGGATTSKIKIQESANGSDFSDVQELTISGKQNDILTLTTTNSFAATTRYVKIIKSAHATGGNIGVGPITIDMSGSKTIETLTISDNNTITIGNGCVLTVTGTLTNNGNASNLIIEDGGQLICNNPVNATLQKGIEAAEVWGEPGADAWYFIASPVDGYETSNVIITGTSDTDLYSFDEESGYWFNGQGTEHPFNTLNRGQGYLYANKTGDNLSFLGTMPATNTNIEKTLSYAGNGDLKGFNLMGNPFTCNLTNDNVKIQDGETQTSLTTYYIVENGTELATMELSSNPIKPGRGFLIQADKDGQKLVFNPGAKRGETLNKPSFIRIEAGDADFMDRAYVQFGQGNTLRKMTINDNVSHVYVMSEGKDYAAATIQEAQGEMPVNFKAHRDGQYTITVNPEEVEMGYLHLIDNISGNDIDLLATPSYTFSAKADDYESRFRLVFSTTMVNAEMGEDFAFISDGQLVIANEGEAILQVIDVTGRVVAIENINGTCSKAINAKAGVYVLRLINGTDVKTQKMVIR